MYVFGEDKLGKLDPVWNYVRTAPDDSIDIFLDDGESNVSIIHITPQRDIELEKYNLKDYKIINTEVKNEDDVKLNNEDKTIDMIITIVGNDLGFAINNGDKVYFFDHYNKCLTLIADGTVNMFSDELYRKIRRYNISKIKELNPIYGIRKIISEYEI